MATRQATHRNVVECAHLILGAARELSAERARQPIGADDPPAAQVGTSWRTQLPSAADYLLEEAEQATCDAVFMTYGEIVDQMGIDDVCRLRDAANDVIEDAGTLAVFAVDDWFEHDRNVDAIADLGAETPEEVAAGYWLYRWLDRQPGELQSLVGAMEAATACLSVALDLLPERSDDDIVAWWVGPESPSTTKARS